ncbi:MAG: hypothetical protein CL677_06270 [Bdellovibrionaceae bacterium]|nr:hypothetical protein [Pseudobdellovibrionaceae bacterium]|tara:strand:- start:23167 stop:24414 length:1248 start_codon:yes stop_codon:yes gene_type:complete
MKSVNESELDNLLDEMRPLVGHRLTDVIVGQDQYFLGFYVEGAMSWIAMDLRHRSLLMILWSGKKPPVKKQQKPIQLFVKKYFVGCRLSTFRRLESYGRVVELDFENSEGLVCSLQIRLFNQGKNIIAQNSEGKSVSVNKVLPLEKRASSYAKVEARDNNVIRKEWLGGAKEQKASQNSQDKKKQINKIKKAMEKVTAGLNLDGKWLELGEWLKGNQSLEVPEKWEVLIDKELSLGENITRAYEKHKHALGKVDGAKNRLKELEAQLLRLESGEIDFKVRDNQAKKNLMDHSGARGRRVWLDEKQGVVLNLGRSAKENLALIRAAKPWHIWLHLRDYPGVHGVIERPKKHKISEALLFRAGQELVGFQFRSKLEKARGDKFDIIYTEVRFVRPIKGDKAGRVNYQSEQVMRVGIT